MLTVHSQHVWRTRASCCAGFRKLLPRKAAPAQKHLQPKTDHKAGKNSHTERQSHMAGQLQMKKISPTPRCRQTNCAQEHALLCSPREISCGYGSPKDLGLPLPLQVPADLKIAFCASLWRLKLEAQSLAYSPLSDLHCRQSSPASLLSTSFWRLSHRRRAQAFIAKTDDAADGNALRRKPLSVTFQQTPSQCQALSAEASCCYLIIPFLCVPPSWLLFLFLARICCR